MSDTDKKEMLNVECPCCGSTLVVEAGSGAVAEVRRPVDARKSVDLKDADQLLKDESLRIHERFRQIVETDKGRGAAMDKKFQDFMDKAKGEPASKPVRDIDLD